MRMQSAYEIAQTRRREKLIRVQRFDARLELETGIRGQKKPAG
jgi:hypothetical protein